MGGQSMFEHVPLQEHHGSAADVALLSLMFAEGPGFTLRKGRVEIRSLGKHFHRDLVRRLGDGWDQASW